MSTVSAANPLRPGSFPEATPAIDTELLIAKAKSEQAQIVGEVVEASIDRMAERREQREEERLEEDRETNRLRAIERRERADADRAVRNAERRAAEYSSAADRGDTRERAFSEIEAKREQGRAASGRARARAAELDIRA